MYVVSIRRVTGWSSLFIQGSSCIPLWQKSIINPSLGICKWNMSCSIASIKQFLSSKFFMLWKDQKIHCCHAKSHHSFHSLRTHLHIMNEGSRLTWEKQSRVLNQYTTDQPPLSFILKPTNSASRMQHYFLLILAAKLWKQRHVPSVFAINDGFS